MGRSVIAGVAALALPVVLFVLVAPVPSSSADAPIGVLSAAEAAARAGTAPPAARRAPRPLTGRTVVLDAGHQLGNARFPDEIGAPVDAGGFTKPCNTTGTATDAGYPEATFAWEVVRRVRDQVRALGATVLLTRDDNSAGQWGPCVDVRGRLGDTGFRGRTSPADLKLSVHGDGAAPGDHGFHVIVASGAPERGASMRYAIETRAALQRAGFARSTYVGGGSALSVRGDLATLNLSDMPTAMVELGNMRNAGDAATMTSFAGQARYARALVAAIRTDLMSR